VPVRAIVVPFPEAEVAPIYHHLKSVLDTLLPPGTVWFQVRSPGLSTRHDTYTTNAMPIAPSGHGFINSSYL
jgi:hypothetical protein